MNRKMDSKEVGLIVGLKFGKYFFESDDLHYGYWPDDLEVFPKNIRAAQINHSDLIISALPGEVHTILDVGCGAGALAMRLVEKGYHVDCVSPSGLLTAHAKTVVGDRCSIIESRFEDLVLDQKYDLVLFSESYQYIDLRRSLEQALSFLRPEGHMLICDFFKKNTEGKSPIGGGHRLSDFYAEIAGFPFVCLRDDDITKETARNYDIVNDFLDRVGMPIWNLIFEYGEVNFPRITAVLKRLFSKKINKLESKYFSGQRTAEMFERYKSYRIMLYQRSV